MSRSVSYLGEIPGELHVEIEPTRGVIGRKEVCLEFPKTDIELTQRQQNLNRLFRMITFSNKIEYHTIYNGEQVTLNWSRIKRQKCFFCGHQVQIEKTSNSSERTAAQKMRFHVAKDHYNEAIQEFWKLLDEPGNGLQLPL